MKTLEFFTRNHAVLCIIAETTGSCPGRTGFKMVVPATGRCFGSVGGGSLENRVMALAREMLSRNDLKARMLLFTHSDDDTLGEMSGMVCTGSQKLLLIPSPPLNTMTNDLRGIRVTPDGLEFLTEAPENEGLNQGDSWIYTETQKLPKIVYIFGGGHCSLALTPLLNSLNLRTVIVDDRADLWTMESNTTAWQRIHMDYMEAGTLVPDNGQALVVIMTASHASDALVLEQMLSKNLLYLGMMASRSTAGNTFELMRSKGFPRERLCMVHSPVGIPIASHTPAEIAVSIAAEIIRELNTGGNST